MKNNKIINASADYYDENYSFYMNGWSEDHFHYGLWYDDTRTHEESLINTILKVVEQAGISGQESVLDSGCGTGGACRYLANYVKCNIIGITLSNELFNAAQLLNKNKYNVKRPLIMIMDFLQTGFKDRAFTRIYSIESMSYARQKKDYIKEAYRILDHGGILSVIDAFMIKKDLGHDDEQILNELCRGWCIPPLAYKQEFHLLLSEAGFESITFENLTEPAKKSSILMHDAAEALLPDIYLKYLSGNIPQSMLYHTIALIRQKECIDRGIWIYGIYSAVKA